MDIRNFKVQKFLMGCFYETDFSYNQNKGKFLNKVKNVFKGSQLAYLEHQELGDILVSKNNKLQIRILDRSMHFEGDFNKENFMTYSKELFKIHGDVFPESLLNKIGFVVYFEKNDSFNDDLFKKYFTNIKISEAINVNFRINYSLKIKDTIYNVNLSLRKDEITKNVNGEIDFNISLSENYNLSIESVFNDLYDYYKTSLFDLIEGSYE